MKVTKADLRLYAITDRQWLGGKDFYMVVEQVLKNGATFLQLREKNATHEQRVEEAKKIKQIAAKYQVPFVVNDDIWAAKEAGADGVHIGQSDMDYEQARKILGPDKIIGVSAQTVEQAILAERHGADYLGVGAVFPTGSKDDAQEVSYDTLKAICDAVSIPVIAIGGITKENVGKLSGSGICGIAVISAIYAQKDIQKAAADLKTATNAMLA